VSAITFRVRKVEIAPDELGIITKEVLRQGVWKVPKISGIVERSGGWPW
jgi:hypothetical protein